jgi:hypothetical protein
MRKNQVQVGLTYRVKVSGVVTDVRLDTENPHGGWNGTNIKTGRSVRVKTAGRLRREVNTELSYHQPYVMIEEEKGFHLADLPQSTNPSFQTLQYLKHHN